MMESPFLIAFLGFFCLPLIIIFCGLYAWAFHDRDEPDTYSDRDNLGV